MQIQISSPEEAIRIINDYAKGVMPPLPPRVKWADWTEQNFWVPPSDEEGLVSARPHLIKLVKHQPVIIDYALDPKHNFQTIVYSTIKKSGKTTIAAAVARYIAETSGPYAEVYCLANDLEQARGRVYQAATRSIELDPRYNIKQHEIPGLWRVIQREATHIPSHSTLRAVSSDYKGEAGSNPTATVWSELWGYTTPDSLKFWDELTPVPTRPNSFRFVETYAGFEDEPGPLWDLWELAMKGRQLTHDDIDWPFDGPVPIWVNDRAKLFAYIDQGPLARRMPWQTPDYYETQAATLRPQANLRLHYNYWTTSLTSFMPVEWWFGCQDPVMKPLPPGSKKPVVIGADAAVSSDCCALTMTARNDGREGDVDHLLSFVWEPPPGGKFNYNENLDPTIRQLCKLFNVAELAYDPYQLHHLTTNLTEDAVVWCKPFNQAGERNKADKQLYDIIRDRRIHHMGDDNIANHIRNAAAKQSKDEDTRFRIIKKSTNAHVDAVVAESMAVWETLRLTI